MDVAKNPQIENFVRKAKLIGIVLKFVAEDQKMKVLEELRLFEFWEFLNESEKALIFKT